MKYKAFTLAEIMIALVAIGIITAILLPSAMNAIPNFDVMKFKKGNSTLYSVISQLSTSGKYFYPGDMGMLPDGNLVTNSRDFYRAFADVVSTKTVGVPTGSATSITTLDVMILTSAASTSFSGGSSSFTVDTYVDCVCKNNSSSDYKIKLVDGISYYLVNPTSHFGLIAPGKSGAKYRVYNPNSSEFRYKYICMQIDGSDEAPFGYALRQDGHIIPGARAKAWTLKSVQENDDDAAVTISSTSSCSGASVTINPSSS